MTVANRRPRLNKPPRLLLVTDDIRLPDPLAAMARLPPGAGVILRHYAGERRAGLARDVARLARRRRLVLVVAGDWRLAARLGADGLHLPEGLARHGLLAGALGWVRRRRRLLLVACHGMAALARARILDADAALLSPVFPTRSHPGAATIGPLRFGLWVRRAGLPVIALGGMSRRRLRRLPRGAAAGMAAIGSLTKS
ncbi:thiamine monophosphate synthase [Paramagnetospirillum caucaseum]|uniref:Thiamine monophosphate synthase n=1 Tax=Paramagnetospirillum caucaseum TaxID=1244869 RepID=M2Z857_9PROT|nr:thiamine phosphate synthase [Paramagnetospirillum caucaseum]EME70495.1 thiamine monophosphate synthase [Paramagnetospirillum caucaseum]